MALNIKNDAVEKLAREVADMAGETKTEAIRRALADRQSRLGVSQGERPAARLRRFLEDECWPAIPDRERTRHLTAAEEDEILGYGPEGV
jgi:antitoxin VapB